MEDLGRHERPQPLREPPARRRPGERTAQAREPGSGRGGGWQISRHRKSPPNGPSPRLRSWEGAGPQPFGAPRHRARPEDPHPRRARKCFPECRLRTIKREGGGRRPGGGGSRAHHPRATGTGWRPEGVGGGEAARAEAAGKVTSGLGARPPDPRV